MRRRADPQGSRRGGFRNRWFADPINLVEAAVVLVAAAALWARLGGRPLPLEPVLAGWGVYALLRRWRPPAAGSPQEPVPVPSPWLGAAATGVALLSLLLLLVAAAGLVGEAGVGVSSEPGNGTASTGAALPAVASRDRPVAAPVLRWGMAWPLAAVSALALWQMARRDARLRPAAGRLLLATFFLAVAGLVSGPLVEQGTGGGWHDAGPGPWYDFGVLVALWDYQLTLARLSAYASARWRLEPAAVHRAGAQVPPRPARRPPVVLSGFYGAGNAGDEAILDAVLRQLRQRGYEDITVFSIRPEETARTHGVKSVYRGWRRDLLAKARALGRAGVFISGGGGLLQDTSRTFLLRGPVPYYLMIASWARLAGCWVLFLGHGVGPLRGRWARFLTRWLASQADVITTRDEGSLHLLEQVGVRRPVRELLADFVFSLPRPGAGAKPLAQIFDPPFDPSGLGRGAGPARRLITVSVRSWPGQDRFFPELAAFLSHVLATRPDVEVVLVPMEGRLDHEASQRLADLIEEGPAGGHGPRVRILPATLTPAEIEAVVAGSWLAVGMRLHFLIFAVRAGVPVLALNYDPKVAGVLGRLGLDRYVYDLETVSAKDLKAGLEAVEAGYDALRRRIAGATRPLAALASAHLDYADAASRRWSGEA
ncbi:polysaccharide pyruvyl transferase family protein [Thermaerobacter subterraneus]|uniref:polysaccharide pyruvyl transferase family protein n=1 Tax=Thermaerobacter subterraneus TaxID=175696 RepID=UPI0002DCCF8D|nr:polysaccharide pyruvyl transferase family protein [Thermaerobacter subterraneus]